jgi:hypothetical protein
VPRGQVTALGYYSREVRGCHGVASVLIINVESGVASVLIIIYQSKTPKVHTVSSVSSYLFSHKIIIVDRELLILSCMHFFPFLLLLRRPHKYIYTSFKFCSKIIAHLAIEHLALVVFSIFSIHKLIWETWLHCGPKPSSGWYSGADIGQMTEEG